MKNRFVDGNNSFFVVVVALDGPARMIDVLKSELRSGIWTIIEYASPSIIATTTTTTGRTTNE
jgi:hypothetical protein